MYLTVRVQLGTFGNLAGECMETRTHDTSGMIHVYVRVIEAMCEAMCGMIHLCVCNIVLITQFYV